MLRFLKWFVGLWIGLVLAVVGGSLILGQVLSGAEFIKYVVVGFFMAIGLAVVAALPDESDEKRGRWTEVVANWAVVLGVFFAAPSAACFVDGRTFDDPWPGPYGRELQCMETPAILALAMGIVLTVVAAWPRR